MAADLRIYPMAYLSEKPEPKGELISPFEPQEPGTHGPCEEDATRPRADGIGGRIFATFAFSSLGVTSLKILQDFGHLQEEA